MTLQSIWRSLPDGIRNNIRRPLKSSIARLPFVDTLLKSEFITLTPETPPAVERALARVADLGPLGDYYEFGLYRGYTLWRAQQATQRLPLRDMKFFGFDSFQGLPPTRGIDAETNEFKRGDYACGRATVESNLNRYGIDWSRTYLIEGFFDVSLTREVKERFGMRGAAVVLIDCDLYESTVTVLHFLLDLLQHRTIVLFDDWNCFNRSDAHGERRAFAEFLAAHPEWTAEPFISFGWHGVGFIMRKSATCHMKNSFADVT